MEADTRIRTASGGSMVNQYQLTLAGVPLVCTFRYKETPKLFGKYCSGPVCAKGSVSITEAGWKYWRRHFGTEGPGAEFSLLSMYLSSGLVSYNRCVFHAAAFAVNGRAWLIAAPPGTGKSTQLKTLKELYPGKITTICGDRPILELPEDEKVIVHPSPWNGKEGWSGDEAAPLAGIILLKRGSENDLRYIPARSAAAPVYASMLKSAEDEDDVLAMASFADRLLARTKVWYLENKGVPYSTKLLYEELLNQELQL